MPLLDRTVLLLSGLFGAAGVAAAATAAHAAGGDLLRTAALFLLIHAAALPGILAASRAPSGRLRIAAAALACLAVGVALFAGDLAARAGLGSGLFPLAAPAGGTAMIAGWLAVALSGLAAR